MKTIIYISKEDFERLNSENVGQILFVEYGYNSLRGGLDSFVKTKKQAMVSDIGVNYKCNDYIVRIN